MSLDDVLRAAVLLPLALAGCESAEPRRAEASTLLVEAGRDAAAARPGAVESAFELVAGAGFEGMILPVGSWRPTRAEVLAAEEKLPAVLARGVRVDGRRHEIPPATLAHYRRQYVGEGRPEKRHMIVYLNCRLQDWPHRIAWARGGGACYIRATWDATRGAFTEVVANSGR